MGRIVVHEFMTLDGVIDAPAWTFEYGFDPKMGDTLAALTGRSEGILLGRATYEMFEPAWSSRTVEDDPVHPAHPQPRCIVCPQRLRLAGQRQAPRRSVDPRWRGLP